MKTKLEIRELGGRFRIEHPHVEHVAVLARSLFDGFSPLPGLSKKDRRLLNAAACLHDIGYASDPDNHVEAGVDILLQNPLPVFSPSEWSMIAAVVLLHQRKWKPLLAHGLFRSLDGAQQERCKKLAAVLRVADGLDHGHLQDASVLACRHGRQADQAEILCRSYAGNIPWAAGKADLWEAAFGRPLRLDGKIRSGRSIFDGIVREGDRALSAARRILYSQYDVMRDQVSGMLKGGDPEHLHDYRVAMRRFRAALKMFRPFLSGLPVESLDKQLGELSDRLGPVRDAHVLLQFVQSLEPGMCGTDGCLRSLEADADEANRSLALLLESEPCRAAVKDMNRFLRVQLPELERGGTRKKFKSHAKRCFSRIMKQARKIDDSSVRGNSERLHALRKKCRRWRYDAEFVAPVLGKEARTVAKHLKTAAGALGDLRDTQARIAWVQKISGADGVMQGLEQTLDKSWRRFSRSRARLADG